MKRTKRSNELIHQDKMEIYNSIKYSLCSKKELLSKFEITYYTLNKVLEEVEELIKYKIYGEVPKHPKTCNLCGGKVKLNKCDKFKSKSGFVYYCTNCHAWVGTHPNRPNEALGELAYKDTRHKRRELHLWFDKLWSNRKEREVYYDRLAKELGKNECHFSQMSLEELESSLVLVKKWWLEKYDR